MKYVLLAGLAIAIIVALLGCASVQRKLLYHPTHRSGSNGLVEWSEIPGGHNDWSFGGKVQIRND